MNELSDKMFRKISTVILLIGFGLISSVVSEDETVSVLRGDTIPLNCPIDISSCGELHSVKWFKGNDRIAVVSGDGNVANVQGDFGGRVTIKHLPDTPTTSLIIKDVDVSDENIYLCESTYLEPLETCNSLGAYSIDLKVLVAPKIQQILKEDGSVLPNGTTLSELRKDQTLIATCVVEGARPVPIVGWYRAGKRLTDSTTVEEIDGLFNVKNQLSLVLSRQELGHFIECRVEAQALGSNYVSHQITLDMQVSPTKIELSGVKHHTVQGTKVLLLCHVTGARPAANVTWYNHSVPLDPEQQSQYLINTKYHPQSDSTFETTSQLIFTASRFENEKEIKCEATNIVTIEEKETFYDRLVLEVLYPPVVTVHSEKPTVNETEDVLMLCDYSSNPASLDHVKWFVNGVPLNINSSRFEGGNTEQTALLMKNATRHDSGNYTCELANSVGTDLSQNEINLNVQYIPIVRLSMNPSSPIIENDVTNITLFCNVEDGNPSELIKVKWYIEGDILTVSPKCIDDNDDITGIDIDENNEENNEGNDEDDDENNDSKCNVQRNQLLLTNVRRQFLGNYSCEGQNLAGWGPRSEDVELNIYYAPGNATLTHNPIIPTKRKSVIFSCSVDDGGNPNATRYRWLRGGSPVLDVVTPIWTVDPVGLDSRTTISCYAYNKGGNGVPASIELDVHAPPAFIQKLPPYSGALFSTSKFQLLCRVECVPECEVNWFKDGVGIDDKNDDRYYIQKRYLEADPATGDFESVESILYFNMTAWPGGKFDVLYDSGNYSCVSSSTSVGSGVRSATFFGVEYPPENTTTVGMVVVPEDTIPNTIECTSKAHPDPTYEWRYQNQVIAKGSSLIINNKLLRTDAGIYTCVAYNKHGSSQADLFINVTYLPTCTISRKEMDGKDTLICTASGNPDVFDFVWTGQSENETVSTNSMDSFAKDGKNGYLVLDDDFTVMRTFRCIPSNSAGVGYHCEIDVAGQLPWWQRLTKKTIMAIIIGVVIFVLIIVILCCIIICVCRKCRRLEKYHPDKSAAADPLTEPGEYENLPFHGLQNAPNKPFAPEGFKDELEYADINFNSNYGPIDYKKASLYAMVNKQKNGKLKEIQ